MIQLTKDFAYLLGALRDGSVCKFTDNLGKVHHSVAIYSKSLDWLDVLDKKFQIALNKKPSLTIPKNRTPFIRVYSKEIMENLNKQFQHPIGKQITWDTPTLIKSSESPEILENYIAGFWDAEGGVDVQNKKTIFYLSWDGDNCPPLEFIKEYLEKREIKSGRIGMYANQNGVFPRFILRILKNDSKKFLETIPLQHHEKKKKLVQITGG